MSSMEDFWRLFGPLALFLRLPFCFWPATAAAVDSSSPSPITSAAPEQAALCMAEPDCPLVGSRRYSCKPKSQSIFDLVVSGGCNMAQGKAAAATAALFFQDTTAVLQPTPQRHQADLSAWNSISSPILLLRHPMLKLARQLCVGHSAPKLVQLNAAWEQPATHLHLLHEEVGV